MFSVTSALQLKVQIVMCTVRTCEEHPELSREGLSFSTGAPTVLRLVSNLCLCSLSAPCDSKLQGLTRDCLLLRGFLVPGRPCGVSSHPQIQTETAACSFETTQDCMIHVGIIGDAHADWHRPHNGTRGAAVQ